MFRRIGIFAGQWRLGHVIPVWSTSAFDGAGSPSPIIYNKLFNILSTLLWEFGAGPKLAVVASFFILAVTAFLGMAAACRVLLGRRDLLIETAAGMLVVFSNYATTDWLTRGAAAEFCAFALVPWVFAWCLMLLTRGNFSLWIGPLMVAMALAHASIALACLLPLVLCAAAAVFRWRWRAATWLAPGLLSVAIAAALISPFVIAALPYPQFASFTLLAGITPIATHLAFGRILWEPVWYWGANVPYLTVQIDPALLAGGVLAVPVAILRPQWRLVCGFLLGLCAVEIFLQSSSAFPIYQALPWSLWIQFAFRLLMFVAVALALCWVPVLDWLQARAGSAAVTAATLVLALAMSLGKPWLGHAPVAPYTPRQIEAALTDTGGIGEPWEYYPRPFSISAPANQIIAQLQRATAAGVCVGVPLDDMRVERAKAHFAAHCAAGQTLVLPIAFAPGMRFAVNGKATLATRVCADSHPRLTGAGDAEVTVYFPTWWRAMAAAFSRLRDTCPTFVP